MDLSLKVPDNEASVGSCMPHSRALATPKHRGNRSASSRCQPQQSHMHSRLQLCPPVSRAAKLAGCWSKVAFVYSLLALAVLACGIERAFAASTNEPTESTQFYVAPNGNDAWSGLRPDPAKGGIEGPLATLEEAKKRVLQLRRRSPTLRQPVVVTLRGGMYAMPRTLVFEPADSGTAESPTIYQGSPGETAILSGGVALEGWTVNDKGQWVLSLSGRGPDDWSFTALYVNDQRRDRPTLPRDGYYRATRTLGPGQLAFSGDAIRADWSDLRGIEIIAIHDWASSRMRIGSVESGIVTFTGQTSRALREGDRFRVANIAEALGEPGEWYLDRGSRTLTYVPRAGETLEAAHVVAPWLTQLIRLQGDLTGRRWVEHLKFDNLTFAHANWTTPAGSHSFVQSEAGMDGAISAIGARNISFEHCIVRHVGGYGLAFGVGSKNNRIERCTLADLGAGGIKIGHAGTGNWGQLMNAPSDPELRVSHHVVRDCRIVHGGRLHLAGAGVWIGHAAQNLIEHNEISDFYSMGISVGWVWGYGFSAAQGNDIGHNHIHNVGQGVLSDLAGVYTLGSQAGTRVHDNHVHHVLAATYGAWGIYGDEGTSNLVVENNLVHHTQSAAFHQHFGKDNHLVNNIFAFSDASEIDETRTEPGNVSFFAERNIFYWESDAPPYGRCHLRSDACPVTFKSASNVYWNGGRAEVKFPGGLTMPQWQDAAGQDRRSVVADPGFSDPQRGDYALKPNSPAFALGFAPLDLSDVGPRTEDPLRQDLPSVPPGTPMRQETRTPGRD